MTDGGAVIGLYFEEHRPRPVGAGSWRWTAGRSVAVRALADGLDAYFAGAGASFDDVPLRLEGTAFQRAVWRALRRVPYGDVVTYGDLAAALARPASAARAIGAANARNPISIVVPCHRVVASTGGLAGYAGGRWRKRYLLDLEATA